jgi:hypothetical protein
VTVTETQVTHQWRIVAPWWHWPRRHTSDPNDPGEPGDRRAVRVSRPALQKYETPDPVTTLLADPQRRLAFNAQSDDVWEVTRPKKNPFGVMPVRTHTDRRKLYLTSHHRYYLVVCSLHCDIAGFPSARRVDVCEAGFVVRRRRLDFPKGTNGDIAHDFRRHALARAKRIDLERRLASSGPGQPRSAAMEARLRALTERETDAEAKVLQWIKKIGKIRLLEGWIPTGVDAKGHHAPMPTCGGGGTLAPLKGVGSWRLVEELPEQLGEGWFPLSPLIADPTKPEHDAAGESIYFGVVPTGSSDLDEAQNPRFDPVSEYEIRCFVRRHRIVCPRSGGHCTCPITWSEPTRGYRLADPLDLEGTANRAPTVHMPDLGQLHADAVRLSPGGTGGVRFSSPPQSALNFTSDGTTATPAGQPPGTQICSFAIPLITIVAYFVLKLFLPIVVFVFQLWFLLALRFCIPPSVTIDATLADKLDAMGGGLAIDANVVAQNKADYNTLLEKLFDDFTSGVAGDPSLAKKLINANQNGQIDDASFGSLVGAVAARKVSAGPELRFAERVERSEVVRP